MIISEIFRVEWDSLFRFELGEAAVVNGELKPILERGLRETRDGFRRQYRFQFGEKFDWVDDANLKKGG